MTTATQSKLCPVCGVSYVGRGRTCSRSCGNRLRWSQRTRGGCVECGGPTSDPRSTRCGACYKVYIYERSLRRLACEAGVSTKVARQAKIEQRLIEGSDGQVRLFTRRRCLVCQQRRNLTRCNRVCEPCKRLGARYCATGDHIVSAADYCESVCKCYTHKRQTEREGRLIRAGKQATPPAGFWQAKHAARQMGYTNGTITTHIRRGTWLRPEDVWQRGPRGSWWVRKMDKYPTWEEERR